MSIFIDLQLQKMLTKSSFKMIQMNSDVIQKLANKMAPKSFNSVTTAFLKGKSLTSCFMVLDFIMNTLDLIAISLLRFMKTA